jgi:UDP-N-acetylmuramoyl-tripeptide--D-alanyl-D-alanine ligase
MSLSVRDILRATGGRLISGYPTNACEGVSIDTRTLQPGEVFFALQGPHFDGHHFLGMAVQKKAKAIVLSRLIPDWKEDPTKVSDLIEVPNTLRALQDTARFVRTHAKNTKVIGLTGSNGKTTTKDMLASILTGVGKTLATRGNLNNQIGLPLMLCRLEPDHQYAILELGTSHPGDMDLLVDLLHPQVSLITNVGKDHLEFFGSPEGVLQENRKLFDGLPQNGIAVINLEDPLLKECARMLTCKTVTYGRLPEAEVRASDIISSPGSVRFTLCIGKTKSPVALPSIGEVQVLNAMAAAAVAHALGIHSKEIVKGLESFQASAMRMQLDQRADGVILVNDAYNANPSSMRASIDSFCRSYPDRPRWLVLGDMRELGDIAKQEHRDLGNWISTQPVEGIYLYGRDARFILEGISGASFKGVIERYRKKRYLIEALKRSLKDETKPAILFKASRSLALEQVSHALLSLPS